ncbi:MAG: hypothetical protein LBG82_06850 [Clostridiales Family XIII bacterium]|jgi:hypothetical protein|nr:hypothetical protein [Clostridiales Family XIII bacterium]
MSVILSPRTTAQKRAIAVILAIALALSLGMAFGAQQSAYAATSDDWMMSYDLSSGDFTYTYVLSADETEAYIQVGPASFVNDTLVPTYFSSEADAQNVADNGIEISAEDDGIAGAYVAYAAPFEFDPGQWAVVAVIGLPDDGSFGALSVKVTNVNDINLRHTTLTICRNETEPSQDTEADNVTVRFYYSVGYPFVKETLLEEAGNISVLSNDYYEQGSTRTYPTGMDALWHIAYSASYPWLPASGGIESVYYPGQGEFIRALTLDGTRYATQEDPNDPLYEQAWMYGVYRYAQATDEWVRVHVAEHAGSDSFRVYDDDLIIWKYGDSQTDPNKWEGDYETLFPDTL